jgi:ATPase subunit of ABC transporter with duplicated ATPase domains
MLELKNLSLYLKRDDRSLAEDFSFTLGRGDKAVLIGEEGNGKSTLLKAVYDRKLVEDYCDVSGEVTAHGKMAYLPQMLPEELKSLSVAEFFDGAEVFGKTELLTRLGIDPDFCYSPQLLGTLSGGEKVKMQLCRLLMEEPDILLLDEPTNDLDIDTLRWLEGFIRDTRKPVLYISHDETLIERSANVIIHMEQLIRKTRCRITVTRMGYRDYLAFRRQSFDHQDQVAKKQREDYDRQLRRWRQIHDRVEHEQRSLSRQDPHSGRLLKKKMHSVQSTGRRLERQAEDFLDFSEEEEAILTRFDPAVMLPPGKTVLDLSLSALAAGDRVLARDLKLHVSGGEIVGITGRNGAGKSTLMKILWEELRQRRDVTAAWMPQDYGEVLDLGQTPLEHLEAVYTKEDLTRARTCLGSMRFTHEEMTGKIARLSGGQRAKLLFLDMVLKKADVLLLDEPTRNFSPLSAPVVRAALQDFGGTILSVSHDRKYLSQVCDAVYELRPDGLHRIEPPE